MCFHADLLSPFFSSFSSVLSFLLPPPTPFKLKSYCTQNCILSILVSTPCPSPSYLPKVLQPLVYSVSIALPTQFCCLFLVFVISYAMIDFPKHLVSFYSCIFLFFLRRSLSLDPVICVDSLIIISTTRFSSLG